ncbi:MAG: lipopolysaccharide biosynthesis protein [Rhodocyclaceae bacterium]|nr:MAG: lipopolysaccharide biosynthesis protein [Rhodocyclaceae bacterium]
MANWLQRLKPKSAFARGVGVLVGGTAAAQLLAVLAAPLLTRLYSPEDFGLLAVYASLLGLTAVIASLRYELAIPLPEHDAEAANVAVLSLLLVGVNTLLAGILTVFLREPISNALGVPQLAPYLWLLPLGVLAGGVYNVFNYWAVRTKRFSTIAGTRIAQSLTTLFIQLTAFKLGGIALLFGQVAGQSAGTVRLGRTALASGGFSAVSWVGIKQVARRYQRFPIYSTWEGLANTAGLQLPPLLFAMLFGTAAAGLYSLANRVLSLPLSLIGNAIGQVFFSRAAEARRNGQLGPLVAQLHAKLAHIGLPPAVLIMLVGADLFALVFGPEWRQAGEFAQWMAPWLYLVFVSSPLSTLFAIVEEQKQGLAFQIILLAARLLAISVGAWIGDLSIAVMLFTGASAACWLGFLLWVGHISGNSARSMAQPSLMAFGVALLCALPVIIGTNLPSAHPLAWGGALTISSLLIGARYWQLLRKAYT